MRRGLAPLGLLLPLVAAAPRPAWADGPEAARFDVGGRIRAVRARDLDGDGRADLIVIVDRRDGEGPPAWDVLVILSPKEPAPATFVREEGVVRIPCSGAAAGPRASAGGLAIGRFGPKGEPRLRFLGPKAGPDLLPGAGPAAEPPPAPSSLERTPGEALAFFDGVADLTGEGRDACFAPDADGTIRLPGITIAPTETGSRTDDELFVRASRVPRLTAADLDGDGRLELLHVDGATLVVERAGAAAPDRVKLPFLVPDPTRPPEQLRAPRLSIADVDGDKKADLLVTLITGRADKLGGLRTSLYVFLGPFYAKDTGALIEPSSRLDTESVALHPRFVDLDGDGDLDYVADSIRGNLLDLVKRVTGTEPTIWHTVFRFDAKARAFEREPACDVERPYSGAQARSNAFGRSGWFEGDFDGDGLRDLLDLGNLTRAVVLRGTKDDRTFRTQLGPTLAAPSGETFAADAVIADLDGDGKSDAVLWTEHTLYFLRTKGGG